MIAICLACARVGTILRSERRVRVGMRAAERGREGACRLTRNMPLLPTPPLRRGVMHAGEAGF